MVEGKRRDEWDRTSHLLALIENVNKASGRPISPAERNPYLKEEAKRQKQREPKSRDVGRLARFVGVTDLPPDAGMLPKPPRGKRKNKIVE